MQGSGKGSWPIDAKIAVVAVTAVEEKWLLAFAKSVLYHRSAREDSQGTSCLSFGRPCERPFCQTAASHLVHDGLLSTYYVQPIG